MHLYLRAVYNIFRQQNNFERTTEQISNTIPDPDQPL